MCQESGAERTIYVFCYLTVYMSTMTGSRRDRKYVNAHMHACVRVCVQIAVQDLIYHMTYKWRPEGSEGVSHRDIQRKNTLGSEISKRSGSEEGVCMS